MNDAYGEDFVANLFKSIDLFELGLENFLTNNFEPDTLCEALSRVHEAKSRVSALYEKLSARTADALGDAQEIVLEDGTKIEKKWSSTRRGWQHRDLAQAVAGRLSDKSVDMETGEVLMSPKEIAEQMVEYLQPSYWKVKKVAELGLDVDNYCEVGETKTSIIVRKNA
jgi:hypothetical protein